MKKKPVNLTTALVLATICGLIGIFIAHVTGGAWEIGLICGFVPSLIVSALVTFTRTR